MRVINDGCVSLARSAITDMFDFVVVDFPDPTNYSLGKLYTTAFYRLLSKHVSANGFIVVQSTSPLFARQSYWCIVNTLKQAGLRTWPYHVYVPSFGEWGFVLAGAGRYEPPATAAGRAAVSGSRRTFPSCSDSPPTCSPWTPKSTG